MVLTVRGKEFKIDFVSNYVHEKYTEMVYLSCELSDSKKYAEIVEIAKTDSDKSKVMLRELEETRRKMSKEITDLRREIIFELLDSNGLTYDATWWQKRTSPDDLNDFVITCIRKDLTDSKPSKKK